MLDHLDLDSKKNCRNCNYPMTDDAIYCSQCSQKYTTGKVPAWTFVTEFFSQQFNIDSKLFRTLFALMIPGKLTNEYFSGKHKKFASPLRVFLVTAIILFATISTKTSDVELWDNNNYVEYAEKRKALERLDTLKNRRIATFNNPIVNKAYDSLYHDFKSYAGRSKDSIQLVRFFGNLLSKQYKVSKKEFAESSPQDIADRYCDNNANWFHKMMVRQQVRILKDGKGTFQFFLGKLTLILFLMMPFLALILKLLYIRREFYYVEHLIFSYHYHAFAFLTVTLLVLIGKYIGGWIALPIVGIFVYQFMAMKKVYQQSYFKTFLKFFALFFLYQILASLFFVVALLISVLLF